MIYSFDPIENYLYFESSSYASSSVGEYYSASWPKENSTSPYTLVHTSGSAATTWLTSWKGYANLFDRNNRDRLVNNLPLHIVNETNGFRLLEYTCLYYRFDMLTLLVEKYKNYLVPSFCVRLHFPNYKKLT